MGCIITITAFHAKYLAHELTKRNASGGFTRIADALSDAQVDLNPHQIEAALFAFGNPLSHGVVIADEVGLGKTISAGIVIAQKWAEEKRKILIIVPANLRKQWQIELDEKFYLPSVVLEGSNAVIDPEAGILIMSYQFAGKYADTMRRIAWDLVTIDEAHRLRNVYKPDNVIAKSIKDATAGSFKLLLTATPLQNSLLELYGLVSFVDDLAFGDLDSFKTQFLWGKDGESMAYEDLTTRLKKVCIRTLRRQVLEYIRYTKRTCITQEFYPTKEEQALYDKVSAYLQKSTLMAIPNAQRYLIALMLWKLLASSTYAIAGTLRTLIKRLERILETNTYSGISIEAAITDEYSGIVDEETPSAQVPVRQPKEIIKKDKLAIEKELAELQEYATLAESIKNNAKGEALTVALDKGFNHLKKLGAARKAVIFTESRRTQEYLRELLSPQYSVTIFNGSVAGTADKRNEIINHFRDDAEIMISTEAAAEGINLQFCSMVINYDLPWNPQRIEQRIGRCHRYGQKFDVVVINFLNKNNAADQRVYELLYEKFLLFDGVFGASDTVLGTIEGVDFERRIIQIYEQCRTAKEIERSFAELRQELETQISSQMVNTKQKLLENFDSEVAARLRVNYDNSTTYLSRQEERLWAVTCHFLGRYAHFSKTDGIKSFFLNSNPFGSWYSPIKRWYYFDRAANKGQRWRLNSPFARRMLDWIAFDNGTLKDYGARHYLYGSLTFDLTNHLPKISVLERYKGKSGYLRFYQINIWGLENENILLFTGYTDDGDTIDSDHLKRFFDLSAVCHRQDYVRDKDRKAGRNNADDRYADPYDIDNFDDDHQFDVIDEERLPYGVLAKLDELFEVEKAKALAMVEERNTGYFESEFEKLDKWAKDIKHSMEKGLRQLDTDIDEARKRSTKATSLKDKIDAQAELKALESRRNEQRMNLYSEQDKIDQKRDELIQEARGRLEQRVSVQKMFVVRWEVV